MSVDMQLEMRVRDFKNLATYLEHHESDIANRINDFEALRGIFVAVFGEEPKA